MKVRVEQNDAFYYPDVMVACDPQDTESLYKRFPCLIVEVLSPSTEGINRAREVFRLPQPALVAPLSAGIWGPAPGRVAQPQ